MASAEWAIHRGNCARHLGRDTHVWVRWFRLDPGCSWHDFYADSVFYPGAPVFNGGSFVQRFSRSHAHRLLAEEGNVAPRVFSGAHEHLQGAPQVANRIASLAVLRAATRRGSGADRFAPRTASSHSSSAAWPLRLRADIVIQRKGERVGDRWFQLDSPAPPLGESREHWDDEDDRSDVVRPETA